MNIVLVQHVVPDLRIGALKEVPRLLLEHAVLVRDADQFQVVLAFGIGNACKARVALFTVFPDCQGVVQIVLLKKALRTVIAIFI